VAQLGNWTEAELYQYAEEALHDAGGRYVLIAGIDSTTALVANQTLYPTLPNQIATIYASAGGAMLAPSSVAEMEALDDDWEEAAAADPTRWVGNNLGEEFIAVYPPSNAAGVLTLVYQMHPPNMPVPAAGQPLDLNIPAPVGDYLAVKALAQARLRQGDGQMLDAAQAFTMLGGLYEKCFAAYWGDGS
jgi:hypothetical protein